MTAGRWIISVLVLCFLAGASFAVSSAISSRHQSARIGPAAGQSMPVITEYLQLTPEQAERVAPINESFCREQHANCADMQAARANLLSVLKRNNLQRRDVDAALAEVERTQAQLQRRAAQYLLDLKNVLTPAQKAKLFGLVEHRFCEQGRCGGGICPGIGRNRCNGMLRGMK